MSSKIRASYGLAALVVVSACGDAYLHTNPYDPAVPMTITINGPDTLLSYSQIATYTGTSVPALPDTAFYFTVTDSVAFPPAGAPAGQTAFYAASTPLWPLYNTVTLVAGVGRTVTIIPNPASVDGSGAGAPVTVFTHTATKVVVLTQRVVRIQLRCPDTHACDTVAVGGSWSVWVDGFDALGQQIVALHFPTTNPPANPPTSPVIATFVSRDPTIASVVPVGVRAATVTALKTGTTWIVGTRGTLADSLQVTVH